MRLLSGTLHGIIDYAVVIILALGPSIDGFSGKQATICYLVALAHLLLTLVTRFRFGALKTLSFPIHGAIELLIALLLLVLPWLANFSRGVHSRNFFLLLGLILFLLWLVTDYRGLRETPTTRG